MSCMQEMKAMLRLGSVKVTQFQKRDEASVIHSSSGNIMFILIFAGLSSCGSADNGRNAWTKYGRQEMLNISAS